MTKVRELQIENSCWNKALDTERMFIILERDEAAPATIRSWCVERIRLGKNKPEDDQIQEAILCAEEMERARKKTL